MTLLTSTFNKISRSKSASVHEGIAEWDAHTSPTARVSPVGADELAVKPSQDVLLTLKARLQAQLDTREEYRELDDLETDSILLSVRRRLDQVNAALARIEQGKYGICTDCNKPVENERIVLRPFSTRCINCQTVAEWRGRGAAY